ncbi:NAD(P)H-dependent oxidoreductase subunit E [Pseudoflavonifractor sp. MSJ-37]|uniref:complex I 24 kDa subunit family protein n=1 Tax=Pseudoflavonifractor sp. MSJ-37 TaxID=2841531 RepID=UPI001C1295AA|nr:NAD(P)H-dependent oxidoreductase subunit E [Pseudoflavonifractor sp. MSJ-37]MBU5435628.1 NAD(P)H-dependent oxidoreductase subunit E [Pseudoflavonifractor sp. MSJ-37]
MLDPSYFAAADGFIARYGKKSSSIIPVLEDIQEEYRYIPRELLTYVADQLGVKESKAYSIATFYKNFSFEPKGKYVIKVCDGTACHVRHSAPILAAIQKELGLDGSKHTSDDMLFTVETVSCLGACGLAPTLTVNDEVHPKMTPEKAIGLIQDLRGDEA